MTDTRKRNPREEFRQLLTRKRLLEEMFSAADRVEQLHAGLDAAVQMGKPSRMLSKSALKVYAGLSEAVKGKPIKKLKELLAQLEGRMSANIQQVMRYAEQETGDSLDEALESSAIQQINEFRRTSKTALALRLLLNERGEKTEPIGLPVEPEELRKQVTQVAKKEQEARVKVEKEIVSIRDDSTTLLKTPGLPDAVKDMLQTTVAQMEQNLEHVRSGKGFDTLPHPMEVLEAGEVAQLEEMAESLPVIEVEELVVEEVHIEAVPESKPAGSKKRGVGSQLNNWLNSSWDVSWKDAAKHDAAKKKGK
jgi:hypothetical protein